MTSFKNQFALALLLASSSVMAQKAGVKLDGIDANSDETSITIKKGASAKKDCQTYEVVDGNEEVAGDPENERSKAYSNWKKACSDWKASMKELNHDNKILTLNCNRPQENKDKYLTTFTSQGSYKLRVKLKD